MDSLSFDGYTSYSDASTPRTPSPTDQPPYPTHPKAAFNDQWPKGSLLQELYNESDSEYPQSNSWDTTAQAVNLMRRSTFPYIRHDREDVQHYHTPYGIQQQQHPVFQQHQQLNSYRHDFNPYNDFDEHHSIKLEESSIMVPSQHSYYTPPGSSAGPASISIPPGPSHNAIYIPSQSQNHSSSPSLLHPHVPSHSFPHPNPHPHAGLVVQHTDDAASKETQYLRRRCFNCHTTEPPSWRRSTLNPGKIVCNKCGLYERTHLRPRPLRFDELRTGGKARKMGIPKPHGSIDASAPGTLSPKHAKRVRGGLVRQSSVSSNSSVHSSSGASDWDDSVSVYSTGSAPTTFNSPLCNNFPPLRDSHSQSPPVGPLPTVNENGIIRMPSNPLGDMGLHSNSHLQQQPLSLHSHHSQQHHLHHPQQNGNSSLPPLSAAPTRNITSTPLLPPMRAHSTPGAFYTPSGTGPMPSVTENVVWTAEPEHVSSMSRTVSLGGGDLSRRGSANASPLLGGPA